jgi:uncharacterized protein YqjF (DUF2071 family)
LTSPVGERAFLRAQWRDLLMLNYEVEPPLLESLVPAGVEMDRWREKLYVSVVGFLFRDTRVFGLAIPGHTTFEEVNLRFYVRRHVGDRESRRGVVFVRELVPRPAIAIVAKLLYNEPYRAVRMQHRIHRHPSDDIEREYAWRSGAAWTRITATTAGAASPLEPDSEAEFITEHYWGYTRQRDGGTVEYRVEHPRWNVWTVSDARLDGDVTSVYGDAFARALARPPASAFVAEGSDVTVFGPTRLKAQSIERL